MSLLYLLVFIFWTIVPTLGQGDSCDISYALDSCRIDLLCSGTNVNSDGPLETNDRDCESHPFLYHKGELYLTLKDYTPNDEIFNLDGNIDDLYIYGLSLANNNLNYIPFISEFNHLRTFNMSHNNIDIAYFYNYYELSSLHELDLSYNIINQFIQGEGNMYYYNILKTLNLSHNNITTLLEGTFRVLKKLRVLNLSYNFIDDLTGFGHDELNQLEILNLSYNRIMDLSDCLSNFEYLKELYLDNNKIHEIDDIIFTNNNNLRIISLKFNMLKNVKYVSNLTRLEHIDVSHNLIDTLDHDTFLYNSNLNKLNMAFNYIGILPKDLVKGKNLFVFDFTSNKLSGNLDNGHFKGLSYVTNLNLSNQQLNSISDHAFEGAFHLSILLLNKNKLTHLSENSFRQLGDLKYLDLSDNQLSKAYFDKSDLINLETMLLQNNFIKKIYDTEFTGLHKLKVLNLENNNITSLRSFIFEDLNNVTILSLSNNPIKGKIEKNVFSGLISLPIFHFSETNINCLSNYSFEGIGELKTINISHNKIEILEYSCFSDIIDIEILDLSYNFLDYFMINNNNLKNLEILILTNNKIKSIFSNTFVNIKSLLKLNMSDNELFYIDNNAFHDQTKLKVLDISRNINLHIDLICINPLMSLQELYISGICNNSKFIEQHNLYKLSVTYFQLRNVSALSLNNTKGLIDLTINYNNVSYIDIKDFSMLSYLENLDLSYNKLTNIQPGSFSNNAVLRKLIISHNFLRVLNFGIFRGLSSIHLLDVSYNMIIKLNSEMFHEIPSLNTIIVDHNNISVVKLEDLSSTNLRVLSIGENPLPCEILVNYRHNNHNMSITAIKLDLESENVYGVTCYKNHINDVTLKVNNNVTNTNNIEIIKDILYNISNRNTFQNVPSNDSSAIFNNLSILLDKHFNKTETILSQYVDHTNKIENNLNNFKDSFDFNDTMKKEQIIAKNDNKEAPSKFTEVCVGLIFSILLCFLLLYVYYNWIIFLSRRGTVNIIPLNETIESQDL